LSQGRASASKSIISIEEHPHRRASASKSIHIEEHPHRTHSPNSIWINTISLTKDISEDIIFQMEAHHAAGVLSAITLTLMLNDIFQIQNHFLNNPKNQWVVVGFIFAAYCFCVGCLLLSARATMITRVRRLRGNTNASNEKQTSVLRTFQMIAIIAGLLVGACSQFLLAALFVWGGKQHRPAVSQHLLLFSILGSLSTVLLAAVGCFLLRFLVEDVVEDEEESSCNLDCLHRQRVLLRMEAYYVSSTLVGICIACICMEIFLDRKEQILPSLGRLAVSLVAFRAILRCFPEEKCLEEAREQEIFLL
jgi:putative flippase GtrA